MWGRATISLAGSSKACHTLGSDLEPKRNNPVYDIGGMQVTYWDFDQSASTSINLFADGTIGTSSLLSETPQLGLSQASGPGR